MLESDTARVLEHPSTTSRTFVRPSICGTALAGLCWAAMARRLLVGKLARFRQAGGAGVSPCMAYILIMVRAVRTREDYDRFQQQLSTPLPRRLPRSFRCSPSLTAPWPREGGEASQLAGDRSELSAVCACVQAGLPPNLTGAPGLLYGTSLPIEVAASAISSDRDRASCSIGHGAVVK
jgi:hypothetical protein